MSPTLSQNDTNIVFVIEYLNVSTNLYNHYIKRLINLLEFLLKSFNIMWILKNVEIIKNLKEISD